MHMALYHNAISSLDIPEFIKFVISGFVHSLFNSLFLEGYFEIEGIRSYSRPPLLATTDIAWRNAVFDTII